MSDGARNILEARDVKNATRMVTILTTHAYDAHTHRGGVKGRENGANEEIIKAEYVAGSGPDRARNFAYTSKF